MRFADRMDVFTSNIFMKLNEIKNRRIKDGLPVFNLSVGTPDFPPDAHVVEALKNACDNPDNFKYSLADLPELSDAVRAWYSRRYGVELAREQVMAVYGSQEGFAHVAFPICNPGDIVIVTDPGYPVFSFGPMLAGAELYKVPLLAENGFLIDFDSIDEDVADRAKMIVVSYPNNPVTAVADAAFYERLAAFAKKHDLIVVHDNAYSELVYDGEPGGSFLSAPGAMDVGIEFNSLSKSYNMTGCRISFAVGNREIISKFRDLRSQIDYGIFLPIQYAAIAALNGPQDILDTNRAGYRLRRDALCGGLRAAGWSVEDSKATMFTWFRIPDGFESSERFALELVEKTGVICVPGTSFGELGEGFVRMALVLPPEKMTELSRVIGNSGLL